MVVSEDDPSTFTIELLSTERKDPVRVVIAFRHPLSYPDEAIHVEAQTIEVQLYWSRNA